MCLPITARDDLLAEFGGRLDAIDERLQAIGLGAIAYAPLRSAAVDALLLEYEVLVAERECLMHRLEVVARGWQRCLDGACDVCRARDEEAGR